MTTFLERPLRVSRLAEMLDRQWDGRDLEVERITSLAEPSAGSLAFASPGANVGDTTGMCVITTPGSALHSRIQSENPRLDFARAVATLYDEGHLRRHSSSPKVHPTAQISEQAILGKGVTIGPRTVVDPFVRVIDGSTIGSDCWLRTGAVVGEQGFGFERDEASRPVRIRHLGGAIIGNFVEVGSLSTVCQGTLTPTIIEDHVKLDDHVHVGHNCIVREAAMIAAFAELSGGVTVGRRSWIGPHASTYQKVRIGDDAVIGVGAVVLRNVADGSTVMGRPGIESKA